MRLRSQDDPVKRLQLSTVAGPSHLEKVLGDIFGTEQTANMCVVFRAFFWLAYAGIPYSDAWYVVAGDLNFAKRVITRHDREYVMYPQAIEPLWAAAITPAFVDVRGSHCPRREGYALLRTVARGTHRYDSPETANKVVTREALSRYLKGHGNGYALSYSSVLTSGIYHRIYQQEKANLGEPDFYELVQHRLDSWYLKTDQDPGRADRSYINLEVHRLAEEYDVWKEIHRDILE